jgi:hypothetical protein
MRAWKASRPCVLEGDSLLPSLVASPLLSPAATRGRLRAVLLYEPDAAQLLDNLTRREPGSDHTKRARVSWLYGRWLARQAVITCLAAWVVDLGIVACFRFSG